MKNIYFLSLIFSDFLSKLTKSFQFIQHEKLHTFLYSSKKCTASSDNYNGNEDVFSHNSITMDDALLNDALRLSNTEIQ